MKNISEELAKLYLELKVAEDNRIRIVNEVEKLAEIVKFSDNFHEAYHKFIENDSVIKMKNSFTAMEIS